MSSRCFLETASHGSKTAKPHAALQADHFFVQKPSGKIAMMQGKNPGPDVKHYSLHNSPNLQTNRKWRSCTIHHSRLLKPNVWPQVRHQLDTLKLGFLLQMLTNLRVLKTGRHTELHVLPRSFRGQKLANGATTSCYANQGSNLVPTHPRGP